MLTKIKKLSCEEMEDKSTVIRNLVARGYNTVIKEKAAELYQKGLISMSEAAFRANLTVWEMEQYLVQNGFRADYSIEDVKKELALVNKK